MILGIDIGKSGGVSVFEDSNLITIIPFTDYWKMNDEIIKYKANSPTVFIEEVHAFPKQGVVTMFSFGGNFRYWKGMLIDHGIPLVLVPPKIWQSYYGYLPKDKKERKQKLYDIARGLFPQVNFPIQYADAVLIGWYGVNERRKNG
mgnify:FL=1